MPAAGSVFWSPAEETAFVDFLVDNKAEAGDGGNFKSTTYQHAITRLSPLRQCGTVKTVQALRNKWGAFKKIYRIIRAIQLVSGWVWDNNTGASITADSASSWDDYVKKHPEAKPFRNRGWRHFEKVSLIMPSAATGANIFHPTTTAPADPSSSPEASPEPETQPPLGETQDVEDADPETPPAVSAGPALGKRPRDAAPTSRSAAKRPCASQGAAALQSMSTTLANFSTTFSAALAPPSPALAPSPVCRNASIAALQHQDSEWLSIPQQVALIDFLRADRTAADIYCALSESNLRREWVRKQLEKLHVYVYTQSPSPSL